MRLGIATSLGIGLGDLCHTLMAVVGISAILMTSANAFMIVKLLGAGYLIYIGLRSLFEGRFRHLLCQGPLPRGLILYLA
ncbi:LysE family translocator [Roseovarius sp. 2305UL8-3]|uniref:LysE family translocator n=1 Tax=Roseovarius conchicola TaxID=3121636 RepID=UPI0035290F64